MATLVLLIMGVLAIAALLVAAVSVSHLLEGWDHRRAQTDPLAIASAVGVLQDRTTHTLAAIDVEQKRRRSAGGA